MTNTMFITYSKSPLNIIVPYLSMQNNIHVINEKTKDEDLDHYKEVWLDCYIDLYDPQWEYYQYLYQFFMRIQGFLERTDLSKVLVRIIRNYSYVTTCAKLSKTLELYNMLTEYLAKVYKIYSIFVPDILEKSYTYHPYNILKNSNDTIIWKKESLFRIIHPHDVVYNLVDGPLLKEPLLFSGIKVSLLDFSNNITHMFGKISNNFESAYSISVIDNFEGVVQENTMYNLETICMNQL